MFSGTIRFNMDPFNVFSDDDIWAALEETNLKSLVVEHGGLQGPVSEAGGNWSLGQRQLLSIARAVLFKRKIVLLDEGVKHVSNLVYTLSLALLICSCSWHANIYVYI
jgi:ABC-type multidrug transport system fused ATPase/permease subunit